MKKVVKRDGRVAEFDQSRIKSAVCRAYAAVRKGNPETLMTLVAVDVTREASKADSDTITVEQVQKLVEDSLMKRDSAVARAYIEYRHDRDVAREERGAIYQKLDSLIIRRDDADMLHENANKNSETIATMR
ncbi:ATP cone domain-containing protein, partial [Enterococcus faecium]|uniref:ATP cone domain-containing protein n=1 Tax=Enterococcus faecium TaxID=1352 RepID=UPI003DA6C1AA